MKQQLLKSLRLRVTMLTAMLCAFFTGTAWGADQTWSHSFASPEAIANNTITVGDVTWNITTTAGQGEPSMTTGTYSKIYGLKFGSSKSVYYGSVTFTTNYFNDYNVKSVKVNILNNGKKTGTLTAQQGTADIGSASAEFGTTWTDLTANTNAGTGGTLSFTYTVEQAFYIHSIEVVYSDGGSTVETCATPTFSLAENYYKGTQNVNIICATEGATIYYTTDGSTPTTSSTSGTTATISESCTLKAIAVKDGLTNSGVASAAYAIVANAGTEAEPFTVADARKVLTTFPAKTFDNVYVSGIISQVGSYNSTYHSITYWISDDGTTTDQFEVYSGKGLNGADFSAETDLTVGNSVVVKGTIKKYNSTFEFDHSSQIVLMEAVTHPVINADDALELEYNANSGSIEYTITNPTEGKTLSATSTADWISNIVANDGTVTFTTTANEGTANRTATITLAYEGAESVTVTVTQKYLVADYATLPFEFNGGKSDFETTAGLTQSGLGSDYSSAPKLKFDGTGDYVVLKFNERPGTLTFDIKNNSFSGGTFKVQTSVDGVTYTDLETYTTITGTQSESFNNLGAEVRYIKWVYTEKSSGNVALGNIKLAKYVAPVSSTLTIPSVENATISASYNTDDVLAEGESAEIEQNTEIILTVDAAEGYAVKSVTVNGPDGQSFAPTAVTDSEGAYRFTMPAYNATISVTVEEYVAPQTATYVLASEIVSGKHYVIANGTADGSVKVMGDQGNNNRPAVDATITDGKLSVSDAYEFVIKSATIDETSGYSIFDAGENGYLYAASSSSNLLKTQEENNANGIWAITIGEGGVASIVAQGDHTRNIMRYNPNNGSPIFACYNSATQSPVYLFVKEEAEEPITVTISAAGYSTLYYGTKNLTVPTGMEAYTVKVTTKVERSKTYNAGDVIPAGEPVVLKAAEGTYQFAVATEAGAKDANNMLKGNDVKTLTTGGTYYYALTLNANKDIDSAGFYWMVANGAAYQAGAHKAYLALDKTFTELAEGTSTGVKGFLALPGNDADGIEAIDNATFNNTNVFNLAGQRVKHMNKGVYVVGGKKVLVK